MAKRLGIVPYRYAAPLFTGLRRDGGKRFALSEELPAHLAIKLRERKLDAAFLSPIDYARDYAMYSVIPEVCAASPVNSSNILVLFREGARSVKTLAVQPGSASEIVLATIVLAEQFDLAPKIVPIAGPLKNGLAQADAVLCSGDDVDAVDSQGQALNLGEEWFELTGLPFVHGVWVTRPGDLPADDRTIITQSAADALSGGEGNGYAYALDETMQGALSEFFRMAYYRGILPDIADLHLYREDDPRLEPGE